MCSEDLASRKCGRVGGCLELSFRNVRLTEVQCEASNSYKNDGQDGEEDRRGSTLLATMTQENSQRKVPFPCNGKVWLIGTSGTVTMLSKSA